MNMQEGRKGIPSLLSSQGECIASNITQLIGWTPLIELKNIAKKDGINARLIGKIEPYQPLSSVKDRSALRLIEDAEEKNLISPGITTLVAVTSGNLGIGVAFVAAQKGYKFIAVMPAKIAIDKQVLLRYLGVEVILVDAAINGFKGLLDRVEQLKNEMENVYVVDQFTNPANPDAHFRSTGPEIWKDTEGKVDIFVAASGSGGTLTGTGRYLKMKNPSVKLICVEPAESAVISGGESASSLSNALSVFLRFRIEENTGRKSVELFPGSGEREGNERHRATLHPVTRIQSTACTSKDKKTRPPDAIPQASGTKCVTSRGHKPSSAGPRRLASERETGAPRTGGCRFK